jgi:hypothetical protein
MHNPLFLPMLVLVSNPVYLESPGNVPPPKKSAKHPCTYLSDFQCYLISHHFTLRVLKCQSRESTMHNPLFLSMLVLVSNPVLPGES